MQLASHGSRASARQISNMLPRNMHARAIHIPRGPPASVASTAQKLFRGSRTLLSRFVTHLTAPALHTPLPTSFARSASTSGRAAIQNGLSFPARVALSRPFAAPCLPRAPAAVPRGITQVGLGTARNFHSSRPLFQNLVENIPVAGRAFYEVDWDVKMRAEKENMKRLARNKKAKTTTKAPKFESTPISFAPLKNTAIVAVLEKEQELEHYFPDMTAAVTTSLLIPLAPTPTSRMPLSETSSSRHPILPLRSISHIHDTHGTHTLRVSALFSRLDAANVWERGVKCSAFAHGADVIPGVDNTCTILKVEFVGWTKAEVRGVIGESGSGWCVLEENFDDNASVFSESEMELYSARDESPSLHEDNHWANDPQSSYVFPTLDFSASSLSRTSPSVGDMESESVFARSASPFSDDGSLASLGSMSFVSPPSSNGYFGFSSAFAENWDRLSDSDYGPRESVF